MTRDGVGGHRPEVLLLSAALVCAMSLGCVTTTDSTFNQDINAIDQALAIRNIGLDHLNNGRMAMAIRELRRSEELNADDALTLLGLGEAFRRRGLFEDCERYLKSALELDPDFQETYISFSTLYIQLERYEESIEYSQHLMDDPTFAAPWRALTNLGWAQLQLGRTKQARQSFEDALQFRRWHWPARLNLGIVNSLEGHRLEAIEGFEWVLEKDTGSGPQSEAAYRLGEIYVTLGSRDRAVEHFAMSAELEPYGLWGKRSKDYLKLLR